MSTNTNTNTGTITRFVVKLKKWSVLADIDPYQPPECREPRLSGFAYGHPKFTTGHRVYTSRIVGRTKLDYIKTLSGTLYELGEVDPNYEEAFPKARERLFNSLPLVEE